MGSWRAVAVAARYVATLRLRGHARTLQSRRPRVRLPIPGARQTVGLRVWAVAASRTLGPWSRPRVVRGR